MSGKPAFKRTQYLVDRAYQLKVVWRMSVLAIMLMLGTLLASSVLLWLNLYDPRLGDQRDLVTGLLAVSIALAVQLVIVLPIIYHVGIRHTHRVVGPIRRITQTLEAIGNGDYSQRIILRKGDVLIDLAEAINQMAEQLERRSPGPGT
ncbi:MAG TPA: HAMP domain-containing protein [bacterium]